MPWTQYPLTATHYGDHLTPAALEGLKLLIESERWWLTTFTHDVYLDAGDEAVPDDGVPPATQLTDTQADEPNEDLAAYDVNALAANDIPFAFDFFGVRVQVSAPGADCTLPDPALTVDPSSLPRNPAEPALQTPRSHLIPTSHQASAFVPTQPVSAPGSALGEPTVVFQLADVIMNQATSTADRGSPQNAVARLPADVGMAATAGPFIPKGTVPEGLITQHARSLSAATNRAKIVSVLITMNDVEAASEFILLNPPDSLRVHLDEFVGSIITQEAAALQSPPGSVQAYALKEAGMLLGSHPKIRSAIREEKAKLVEHLEGSFCYVFDTLFGSKDRELFDLGSARSPAKLVALVNEISTLGAHLHDMFVIKMQHPPMPVTVHTHYEVDNFHMAPMSVHRQAAPRFHQYRACKALLERQYPSRQARRPFVPTEEENKILLAGIPPHRLVQRHLWIALPGNIWECYYLDFQGKPLLKVVRFNFEEVHDADPAVVRRFLHEQRQLTPFTPGDQIYRVIPAAVATLVTGLYCVRAHPAEFLAGMTGKQALKKTPNAAVVFQAKILEIQNFLEKWISKKPRGYVLLRHRILGILEDIVVCDLSAANPLVACDLTGPAWLPAEADHMAYSRSHTARRIRNNAVAALTMPASLLAASNIASKRTLDQTLQLFGVIREREDEGNSA